VQTQSTVADVFHSLRGGSGDQLTAALRTMDREGNGVLVYLRQEGRGSSLIRDIKSHALKEQTVAAESLESRADLRTYGIGAQILRALGVRKIRLLTNHPKKIIGLQGFGIVVEEQIPLDSAVERGHGAAGARS